MKKMSVFFVVFFICQNLIGSHHSVPSDQDGITTFFLVRHAEKVRDGSADPPLTASGAARAEELAYMLKHIDLNVIYSTPYRRTKQTAMPTAREKGLDVKLYKPGDKGFLAKVLQEYPGGNVLIVGHSNTIPGMANELRGEFAFSNLDDSIYDNLFIACVPAEGKPVILQIRFGAHSSEEF